MSARIGNLKDENGDTFYPITKTNAVLDENNVDVATSISNKVTKTGDSNKIYGTDSSGNQTTLDYQSSQSNSANKIVQRDANRDVLVPTTPTSNNSATSKSYVDGLINNRNVYSGQLTNDWTYTVGSGRNAEAQLNWSGNTNITCTFTGRDVVVAGVLWVQCTNMWNMNLDIEIGGTSYRLLNTNFTSAIAIPYHIVIENVSAGSKTVKFVFKGNNTNNNTTVKVLPYCDSTYTIYEL